MAEKWGGKPNGSRWWTNDDIKLLKELRGARVCGDRLAETMGRSKVAIWSKSKAIGLATTHFRTWTKEQEDLLRKYHAEGLSFSTMAKLLGHNKNACIGKAHRMDLPKRPREQSRALGAKIVNQARRRKQGPKLPKPSANIRRRPVMLVNGNTPRLNPIEYPPISLVQIKNGQCKFIEGDDHMMCGREALNGFSWCPHHYARTHILDKRYAAMARVYQQPVANSTGPEHTKQTLQGMDSRGASCTGHAESEASNR